MAVSRPSQGRRSAHWCSLRSSLSDRWFGRIRRLARSDEQACVRTVEFEPALVLEARAFRSTEPIASGSCDQCPRRAEIGHPCSTAATDDCKPSAPATTSTGLKSVTPADLEVAALNSLVRRFESLEASRSEPVQEQASHALSSRFRLTGTGHDSGENRDSLSMSAAPSLGWPGLGLILPAGPEPEGGGEPDQDERGGDEGGASRARDERLLDRCDRRLELWRAAEGGQHCAAAPLDDGRYGRALWRRDRRDCFEAVAGAGGEPGRECGAEDRDPERGADLPRRALDPRSLSGLGSGARRRG